MIICQRPAWNSLKPQEYLRGRWREEVKLNFNKLWKEDSVYGKKGRKKKKKRHTSSCPLIMMVFKSQKGEMDADKHILSLTKAPHLYNSTRSLCISVLTPLTEYFQLSTGVAARVKESGWLSGGKRDEGLVWQSDKARPNFSCVCVC